jgi:Phosphotransferase enzyme family
VAETEALIRARFDCLDDQGIGLVHGDPHFENVLWDGVNISAVIDLEWARRSWLECDLETLLSVCDHPWFFLENDEHLALSADYVRVPGWMASEYPEWFAHPRLADRLTLLHLSRTLGLLREFPPSGPRRPSDPRDRRNHVRAALDGTSYLHRVFAG